MKLILKNNLTLL